MPAQMTKAAFVEPMLLLPTSTLPEGSGWQYELKLDGYRAIAVKTNGRVQLRSRNNKDFNKKYPRVAEVLAVLPDETVIDGEIVAFDDSGRPSFNALQNYGSSNVPILYYVFKAPSALPCAVSPASWCTSSQTAYSKKCSM